MEIRWTEYALRWTMPGPDSSYSCFEHQRFWKVDSEARMEPPIQTEYFRSGGATILTCGAHQIRYNQIRSSGDSTCLHARRRERGQLLLHTVRNTREHGGTTGKDNVTVQITTDIEITLVDRVVAAEYMSTLERRTAGGANVRSLVDTRSFKAEECGLEERLRSTESDQTSS